MCFPEPIRRLTLGTLSAALRVAACNLHARRPQYLFALIEMFLNGSKRKAKGTRRASMLSFVRSEMRRSNYSFKATVMGRYDNPALGAAP